MSKIIKPTWIIHGVLARGGGVTYHTHGLNEYGSLELELNLSLEGRKAAEIINTIGLGIANGLKFSGGDTDDSLVSCKIAFREVIGVEDTEGLRVLRIILPDPKLRFPWDEGCEEPYKSQIKPYENYVLM